MSTNKTKNFGLHAWEAADDFLREEFNENFDRIDVALTGLDALIGLRAKLVFGAYAGNGVNSGDTQLIALPEPNPRAVMVIDDIDGFGIGSWQCGGLALPGLPARENGKPVRIEIVEGGFLVRYDKSGTNAPAAANVQNRAYRYIAFY